MSIIDTIGAQFTTAASPNRFEVEINYPFGGSSEKARFMCKATTVPSETIGEILIGYQSQKLKIAGDREYADWTVTVYNMEDWTVRNDLEKWMRLINDPELNIKSHHAAYFGEIKVVQKSTSNTTAAIYVLKGAWPKLIGDINLDWETNDDKETFDCTFSYQYLARE